MENQMNKYSEKQNKVDISFENVSVTVKTKNGEKQLLKNVSGICKNSEITAILGSSGAGKTTLLNVISSRIVNTKSVNVSGKIQANSTAVHFENFSNYASYVMQDDVLLETMTVKECLQFAANLKVNGNQQQKNQIVAEIIRNLKLEKCENTFVGGQFVKGISGGERKRTSIGYELVTNPSVLILDEPTSGLDSFTAYLLIRELKRQAQTKGKTIIFTIHSPSSDIWLMFDRIMLLVEGNFIYQGPGKEQIINHFSYMGFNCPKLQNPADYFLSIMHNNGANSKNFPIYFDAYEKQQKSLVQEQINNKETSNIIEQKFSTSFIYQTAVIAQRALNNFKRNPILFKARIGQAVVMGLIIGLIYLQLEDGSNHPTSIRHMRDRTGYLFFISINQFMMSLSPCLISFPSMRGVFLREQNAKLYSVFPYFLGRLVVEIIPQIISPIIFGLIQFWMIGLNDERADNVIFYLFVLVLLSILGLSIGYLGGAIFKHAKTAVVMGPIIFLPNALFGGYFKNRNDFATWIGWIEYIFPIKYSFNALSENEFENTAFTPNPTELLNLEFSKWNSVYIMFGFIVGYLGLSYLFLNLNKKRVQ